MADFDSVKLLMFWDIKDGQDQEYFEFVVREWLPNINRMGIDTTWSWYTVYSRENTPQFMAEAYAENIKQMRDILRSPEWERLHAKLLEYVDNYHHKVVNVSGNFQL